MMAVMMCVFLDESTVSVHTAVTACKSTCYFSAVSRKPCILKILVFFWLSFLKTKRSIIFCYCYTSANIILYKPSKFQVAMLKNCKVD